MTTTRISCFSLRAFAIFHFNLLCLVKPYIYPKSKIWHYFVMNFQTELFPLPFPTLAIMYFSRSFDPSPPLVFVTFLLHHPRACAWYCPVLWWEGPSLGVKLVSLSASPTLTTNLPCLALCLFGWLVRRKVGDQAPSLKSVAKKKNQSTHYFPNTQDKNVGLAVSWGVFVVCLVVSWGVFVFLSFFFVWSKPLP